MGAPSSSVSSSSCAWRSSLQTFTGGFAVAFPSIRRVLVSHKQQEKPTLPWPCCSPAPSQDTEISLKTLRGKTFQSLISHPCGGGKLSRKVLVRPGRCSTHRSRGSGARGQRAAACCDTGQSRWHWDVPRESETGPGAEHPALPADVEPPRASETMPRWLAQGRISQNSLTFLPPTHRPCVTR